MKKFQFSLEKVLEVKEIEEKILQKDLLLIQKDIIDQENKILDIQEKISQERINLSLLNQRSTDSAEMMMHYKYLDSLHKRLELFMTELKTFIVKEEKIKSMLVVKSQEKKSLERLKEIKYDEFQKNYKKQQQIVLDEVSIQNFRMKQDSHK
ncbi:MAG: flagellar FliJ family protein [Candidatus Cloacimonetes bacterium]|jgi:flagellar FliJ protein|nr:flagellar FliJ family protein [Candidatus Cloacimonadota bacterium]HPM01446.1 flagellar FliJ family protein [Candidatus Cloacimonadota bacterium]